MLLSTALAALSLLAAVAPAAASSSHHSGLHRRRCRANPGSGGSISTTSSPDDAPETSPAPKPRPTGTPKPSKGKCFPSANFDVPDSPNGISTDDWWCDSDSEYAFMGFSWAINGCPSKSDIASNFKQMKQFGARYVRLYGACDRGSFNDDLVDAAYSSGMGVYYLVWFGFDGSSKWKDRLNGVLDTVDSNPRAKYVIRTITLGSEALFDHAISAGELVNQLGNIRDRVKSKGIKVSTSEMAYLLKDNTNVLDAVDNAQLNVLPFFAGDATHGSNARNRVLSDVNGISKANGSKKILLTQTGWPSTDEIWKANSRSAVASVSSEAGYYDVLDGLCDEFKGFPKGGVGWFAHVWDDAGLGGWGIMKNGKPKFDFNPRTKC